jgi:hypothetical protein
MLTLSSVNVNLLLAKFVEVMEQALSGEGHFGVRAAAICRHED